nr:unnamed protein product [Trichobilharzia regenti]
MLPSQDTNHTAQQSSTSMQTACHPNHVNISTGGLLVHGNHFNSVSKEPSHPNKLHHPVRKQTNLAESDPPLFVQLLTERLEKVKESRDKVEKLMSLVNQVDEKHSVESGHSSVPLKDTKDYNRSLQLNNSTWCQQDATNSSINPSVNEVNFTSAHIIHSSTDDSKRLNHPHESVFHKNRRHTDKSQDAQEILDDHCSRIWADELGDSTINASKTYYRRQQSDCSRNTTSRSSTTPYPIISDTLVHSMHSSLVRGGSSGTEYEMKRLSEQYRTTTASYSSANSNNNINSNQPTMSDSSHRRWHTAGSYRGMNRVNKSDVRSTASWDSGVVTSYEMKSLNLNNNADDNDYLDAETSSILEAASVQALSSSTTELALVNGEVTAKLVEKMIRHYPHKTFNRDSRHNGNMLPLFNSNQGKKETINPGYEYKYRLERKWQQQQQSGHFYESPYVQGFNPNSSICSACQHSADRVPCDWNHHCFHYPSTHSASNEHSSPPHLMVTSCGCNQSSDKSVLGSSCRSFPTASDTSSTFDSGISSAYDQLPLQKHTNNRENRSQSLHNWQMNVNLKDTNLSTPRGNRTHSASKSSCDSNNTSRSINYPQTNCFISSCYEFNLKQLPGHYMQNDLCPTRHHHCPEIMTIKDVNKHDGNECKKPSSESSLQSVLVFIGLIFQQLSQHVHGFLFFGVHMDSRLTNTQQQQQTSNVNSSGPGLVVGYYLCDDPVPYRTVWTGPTTVSHNNQSSSASSAVLVEVNDQSQTVDNCQTNSTGQPLLTLGQFKQLIAKKGVYRYFFKKPNDEFGTGVVHEELTNDDATLPLWEGKVVARVERAD